MLKIIYYLDFTIEITFTNCDSQFRIYQGDKFILFQDGYPGFNYKQNGLLEEAQWSIERHIALSKLKQIKHPAFQELI